MAIHPCFLEPKWQQRAASRMKPRIALFRLCSFFLSHFSRRMFYIRTQKPHFSVGLVPTNNLQNLFKHIENTVFATIKGIVLYTKRDISIKRWQSGSGEVPEGLAQASHHQSVDVFGSSRQRQNEAWTSCIC